VPDFDQFAAAAAAADATGDDDDGDDPVITAVSKLQCSGIRPYGCVIHRIEEGSKAYLQNLKWTSPEVF